MLFNSYQFTFGFLPIALLGFGLLAHLRLFRATAAFLVLASLFFYSWWNWHYLFLFGFSIAFNYSWSLVLMPDRGGEIGAGSREGNGKWRRTMLGCGVAVNLALLGYFKYRNFLVDSAGALLGTHWKVPPLVLPLAVSFFTFEQVTYLVSSYRDEAGSGDFISYCLFISFFPHLIAGPIVRYGEIYPQLNRDTRFALSSANLAEGLMIFAIGLFKKVILADSFRAISDPLFATSAHLSWFDSWGAALAFSLQIYFDFSGYTDMAIGLARMFGVKFPENFNSPYQSRSVIEFWRRWHMTLSFFLRDYLYIPLGGNRRGELRRHLNLFITMLLGGLWHGANWTFVIWGALHGIFLSINHLWTSSKRRMPDAAAWALTFFLVTGAWVFFRAQSFAQAISMLEGMAGRFGFAFRTASYSIGWPEVKVIAVGLLIVLFCPNRQAIMEREWRSDWAYAAAFALMSAVSIMSMSNPPPFIYFQF